jgi:predicted DNA-binding transcriptional regulator AlpA
MQQPMERLLTTGQVATFTGMSESYFEKGRVYGYGPPFIRLRPGSKSGAVRYRLSAVMRWLEERQCNPEEVRHG